MKSTIRVQETKEIKTSQNEIAICIEGKLLLIKCTSEDAIIYRMPQTGRLYIPKSKDAIEFALGDNHWTLKPIIISETEKIEEGDKQWCAVTKRIKDVDELWLAMEIAATNKNGYKILALSEHFTHQQFQDIADGKMKEGDKVLIECIRCVDPDIVNMTSKQYFIIKHPLIFHN